MTITYLRKSAIIYTDFSDLNLEYGICSMIVILPYSALAGLHGELLDVLLHVGERVHEGEQILHPLHKEHNTQLTHRGLHQHVWHS